MTAMVPIFYSALRNNLSETEMGLTRRALESDALSARLQAASLEDVLLDRLEELQEVIADEAVQTTLEELMQRPESEVIEEMRTQQARPMKDRPRWMQLLDTAQERCDDANTRRNRSRDSSWFLTNSRGVQLWRRSFSADTLGENFSRRDYFHGRNLEYPEDAVPADIAPIREPHISLAYRSDATGRYMVAISLPVRDRQNNIIGVFARTAQLGDLQEGLGQRWQSSREDSVQRYIALTDSRDWQLVDHPYLTEARMQKSPEEVEPVFRQLTIDRSTRDQIAKATSDGTTEGGEVLLTDYRDPVESLDDVAAAEFKGPWMAAMSPVSVEYLHKPWMVIVQERRDTALLPLKEMTERATRHAWMAVLASLTLMAIVWSLVWRAFNRPAVPGRPGTEFSG
jgi:hypothetical protein